MLLGCAKSSESRAQCLGYQWYVAAGHVEETGGNPTIVEASTDGPTKPTFSPNREVEVTITWGLVIEIQHGQRQLTFTHHRGLTRHILHLRQLMLIISSAKQGRGTAVDSARLQSHEELTKYV